MKKSIAHCYFMELESVKDACKSLLKECRLDAPPVTMTISRDNLDQLKHETSGMHCHFVVCIFCYLVWPRNHVGISP